MNNLKESLENANRDYRNRIDELRDKINELVNEINGLVDDYTATCNTAEQANIDFEEDIFEDYAGWVSDLDNLREYINEAHINI